MTVTDLMELIEEESKETMVELAHQKRDLNLGNEDILYNQVHKLYENEYKRVLKEKTEKAIENYAHDIISPILEFADVETSISLIKTELEYRDIVEDIYISTTGNETQYTVDNLLGY